LDSFGTRFRHGKIRASAQEQVEARRKRTTENKDILGRLFEVQFESPDKLDNNAILSLATSKVFAGSDTTAITLRAIVYFLPTNPACLQNLLDEIDQHEK
jgi:cytochrome P450